MRRLKFSFLTLLWLVIVSLSTTALAGEAPDDGARGAWRFASRDTTAQAPLPADYAGAVIQVYAARTWSWRGKLAVHTWISTKEAGASAYHVHQVIGFRAQRGLPVVSSEPDVPDRLWYGNQPELLVDLRGDDAAALLPRVLAAVQSYPYAGTYLMWPGPNSNTFTAYVGRQVPQLGLQLPVTAIGKDYLGHALLASTPSGTGYQVSLLGALGLMVAVDEGLEINVLGLSAGIDLRRPALKLPGIGRIGTALLPVAAPEASNVPQLRVRNDGTQHLAKVTLIFPKQRVTFTDVAPGTTSDYQRVPGGVYAYAAIEYQLPGQQPVSQPVTDWTGERPLPGAKFSYVLRYGDDASPGRLITTVTTDQP